MIERLLGQECKAPGRRSVSDGVAGKDPGAQTDFLPDRERVAAEEEMRLQLKQEYTLRQQVRCESAWSIRISNLRGHGRRCGCSWNRSTRCGSRCAAHLISLSTIIPI